MTNAGLLFIPDISGFTKFVNETEIEHSRYIIAELLESIINSNKIGLTISEIEGDAVLFYRFGKMPSLQEIYEQVEIMFCNFQKKIKNYELRRGCQCRACVAAVNLSLKIITHYGEFSTYNVKSYNKLIGKDVIVAHQLLKNDIDLHEYLLITADSLTPENDNVPQWMKWQQGRKLTEKGEVNYQYSMLTSLKESVQADPLPDLGLGDKKIKFLSVSKTINAMLITVLSIIGNLSLRPKWMEGVTKVEMISHPINHLGVKHRSIYNGRRVNFYSSTLSQHDNIFCYSETDEQKKNSIDFTITALAENKTLVTIDYCLNKNYLSRLFFSFIQKKKLLRQLETSLNNLAQLIQQGEGYMPE